MKISKTLANNIVNEMKEIIGKNINYIDTDGNIIASTDKKRIETYHEGGIIVAKTNEQLIIETDSKYVGTKPGINLPVMFQNEVIGVIGISGKRNQIEKYGQIIKKMTEILIKEAYIKELEDKDNEYERILLETLIADEKSLRRNKVLYNDIDELPVKEEGRIFVIKTSNNNYNSNVNRDIFRKIKNEVKNFNGYIMIKQNVITILVFRMPDKDLDNFLNQIIEKVENKFNTKLKIGVGNKKQNIKDLKTSYDEAIVSLEWSMQTKKSLTYYKEMKLEIILSNINDKIKNNFLKTVFLDLSSDEIVEYKNIINLYEKYNGSIEKIANELFVHKNTLQYKINKLKDKIGLDMRNYGDFAILKIAFILYD